MTDDVIRALNAEGENAFHNAMLQKAMACVKESRRKMSERYADWTYNDEVYRGIRQPDLEDRKNSYRGKPIKMIVPNTFAQVQTFVSYLFLLFNQNRNFFELVPTGAEDAGNKRRNMELVLANNLRKNRWNTTLYQNLAHTGIFGLGILSCEWTRKIATLRVKSQPIAVNYAGQSLEIRPQSEWRDFVKYEGCLVEPISPYRFFPDTQFPLTEALSRGNYCFIEQEYSMADLYDMQSVGEVAGIDRIEDLPTGWQEKRGGTTFTVTDFNVRQNVGSANNKSGKVLVTRGRMKIVPKKFMVEANKPLGPEEFPVLYHVWYANDNRIIRLEPAEDWHNTFGITMSQFTPDMHDTLSGMSLAGLICRLQDTISWFINSHVREVNRAIANRKIINPDAVDMKSVDGEGDIFLRKGFGRRDVREAVGQMAMSDTTGAHMGDAQVLSSIMQLITGVNDQMQGQYSSGRRDATQSRIVAAGAAGRMKLHGHLIWEQGLAPLGDMMLTSNRQSLGEDYFNQIIGQAELAKNPNAYLEFVGTPEEVICGDSYFIFDSTTQLEKGFTAQSLQELLSTILQVNPAAAAQFLMQIDPAKIFDEMQYLRNGSTLTQFRYDPAMQPTMPMLQSMPTASA